MSVYLHDIPLDEAQSIIEQALNHLHLRGVLGIERIPLDPNAVGRVLAEPVWAQISSPHYHAAAMDGFAVRAAATNLASLTAPVDLLVSDQAVYVDTGDPLPGWANAVIPIEEIEPLDKAAQLEKDFRAPSLIRIRASVPPWKHVRPMGEDMVATELVLPAGQIIRPVDLGAAAGCGHHEIAVAKKPRVAILPTGTELRVIGEKVGPGEIIEFNSVVLAAQIKTWGGVAEILPILPDDQDEIAQAAAAAAESYDLVLLLSGSSAGSEDFSAAVIETVGKVLFHGVAVRPGHPVIFGLISQQNREVPVFGVPGYPVSAALTGEIFIQPLLQVWTGQAESEDEEIPVILTRKIVSPLGDADYVRVAAARVGQRLLAAPLQRGAGVISSLVRADGILVIPKGEQGFEAGKRVNIRLLRSKKYIDQTILATGSHDMSLDLLAQSLSLRKRHLVSSNVGSIGGLIALRRDEAHLAGSHLLEPSSGEYNLPLLREYITETPLVVMGFVYRQQGLICAKDNPKGIEQLEDLSRSDLAFVNRQRGSGTWVLLDYELGRRDIKSQSINGYEQEEYTHLAVAAAVASGRADCGMGIPAAAAALALDFIPLFSERYDLIIPQKYFNDPLLNPLIETLNDVEFQRAVGKIPGYDIEPMGRVIKFME